MLDEGHDAFHVIGALDEASLRVGCLETPAMCSPCLLYTSDAADERSSVDLGGRRIIKKKTRGATRVRGGGPS